MNFDFFNIKLVVGLGNVGKDYVRTRHNAGFMFVDSLAEKLSPSSAWKEDTKLHSFVLNTKSENNPQGLLLAKPTTLMNLSGRAVSALMSYYKLQPEEILIAHDDMDISIGGWKIQFDKGPKVHNGIASIEEYISTSKFWRLRLGIENRVVKGNKGIPGRAYALQRFAPEEVFTFNNAIAEAIHEIQI